MAIAVSRYSPGLRGSLGGFFGDFWGVFGGLVRVQGFGGSGFRVFAAVRTGRWFRRSRCIRCIHVERELHNKMGVSANRGP